jgi:carbon storage regulator
MLVLSRKENEEILIGDNIRVVISRVAGDRVSIAIDAPREVSIRRGELTRSESPLASAHSRPVLSAWVSKAG